MLPIKTTMIYDLIAIPGKRQIRTSKRPASIILIALLVFITTSIRAQTAEDTTGSKFRDDLLDHLVGTWNVTSIANGFSSTAVIEAKWILNHQHLHLHFKGNDIIPWIGAPMEFDYFIGYNHNSKRYVIHAMSVFGNDDDEGFWYAYRNGNEIKIVQKPNVQRFTWEPASNSWHIESRSDVAGKEGEIFLDMKLKTVKASSK